MQKCAVVGAGKRESGPGEASVTRQVFRRVLGENSPNFSVFPARFPVPVLAAHHSYTQCDSFMVSAAL